MNPIDLRPHHIANLIYHHQNNFETFEESHEDYTPEFSNAVYNFYKTLLKNKSLEVKITKDFDTICNFKDSSFCNLKDTCSNSWEKDLICEQEYGIIPGEDYRVDELLEIGKNYSSSTDYETPLHKFMDNFS